MGLPKLIINAAKDTVPVNSEFEAEYNIEDSKYKGSNTALK